MNDTCLLCPYQPLFEITAVSAVTIAARAVVMAVILVTAFLRLQKSLEHPSFINWTFLFLLVITQIVFLVQTIDAFVVSMILLSDIWNILSSVMTLIYLLSQIYLLAQFRILLKFRTWFPKALAVGSTILYVACQVPLIYFEVVYRWTHSGHPWIIYVVVIDVAISLVILRGVIHSTNDMSKQSDRSKKRLSRLKWMIGAVLALDGAGILVSLLELFAVDRMNSVSQLFAENDIVGLHLVVGTTYLGALMSWAKSTYSDHPASNVVEK